ncbi:hypothetical protein D3C81_2168630 [compost metagenome]
MLGHRGGLRRQFVAQGQLHAAVDPGATDLDFCLQLGEREARVLEVDYWLAEYRAAFGVIDGMA